MAKSKTQGNNEGKVVTLKLTDEDREFGEYLDRLAEKHDVDTDAPKKPPKKLHVATDTDKGSAVIRDHTDKRTRLEKPSTRARRLIRESDMRAQSRRDEVKDQEVSHPSPLHEAAESWENLLDDESYKLLPLAFADDLAGERRKLASMIKAFKKLDAAMAEAQAYQQTHGSLVGFADSQNVVRAKKDAKKSKARAKKAPLEVQVKRKKTSAKSRVSDVKRG